MLELEKKDIPSFKNLWLFGPSIFVEFTHDEHWSKAMHVLKRLRTLKRFYKPCVWPRWSTYGHSRA
jgi:hypothetical protein